jgi:chromosome segregation ATPase
MSNETTFIIHHNILKYNIYYKNKIIIQEDTTMSDFETKISERMAKAETSIEDLKEDVKVLSSIENAITKIATLIEVQSKALDKMDRKIDNTDAKIDNLKTDMANKRSEDKKASVQIKTTKISSKASIIVAILGFAAIIGGALIALLK